MRGQEGRVVPVLFAVVLSLGCDGDKPEDSKTPSPKTTVSKAGAAPVAGAAAVAGAVPDADALSDTATFDEEMKKKECDLLTPSLVAQLFEVPEAELKQVNAAGSRSARHKVL